jgi:single-strand DNA-binding protein
MSVNKVILIGNVGKDPIIRNVKEDLQVASFTIATNEVYKDAQGVVQKNTDWHNIVAWRNLAQIAEKYIKKGSLIYVEGRLKSRSYTDKENQNRTIVEVLADKIQLLGKKEDETHNHNDVVENIKDSIVDISTENQGDDLPF